MGLADVTADAVRRAMAEFDGLGRDAFLRKYGFGRARDYFIIEGERRYDSKAIVGAAHGLGSSGQEPLRSSEFSGGEQTVAAHLESLGFAVSRPASAPDRLDPATRPKGKRRWADPELILALDLYLRGGVLDDRDPQVVQLSELLKRLPLHPERPDAEHFRSPSSVALKLANFASLDPGYPGKGMDRVGRRDAEIWEMFAGNEADLREAASRIRAGDLDPYTNSGQSIGPTISTVPIEARNVGVFAVQQAARTAEAERREQQLVIDFRDHLERQGHRIVRHRYMLEGRSLYCDLFDETDRRLYEAKGDVTRESLRMAVGQLLDYARNYQDRPALGILLPRTPSEDMLRYLASVAVSVVFRDASDAWKHIGVQV